MIRGISKKIIEVNDTGSEFFEKALFVVKSDSSLDDKKLKNEADKIVLTYFSDNTDNYHKGFLRTKEEKMKEFKSKLACFFVGGAVFSVVLLALQCIF